MRRTLLLLTLLVAFPSTALAQEEGVTIVDPAAQSPSGTQYEIPVETGRRDAAPTPKKGGGTAPSTAAIQTKEGYGTPTQVPGTSSSDDASSGSGDAEGTTKAPDVKKPTLTPEPQQQEDAAVPPAETVAPERVKASGPSVGRSMLLLAIALIVGLTLGGLGRRATR